MPDTDTMNAINILLLAVSVLGLSFLTWRNTERLTVFMTVQAQVNAIVIETLENAQESE